MEPLTVAVSDFFSGQQPEAANPLRPHGLTCLVVGAVYLVAGGITALTLYPEVRALTSALQYGASVSLGAAFDGIRAIVGGWLCLRGARMISSGIGGLTRVVIPPAAPAALTPAEAEAALVRREPGVAGGRATRGLRVLEKWFPFRATPLTPRLRGIVDAGLGELSRFGRIVLVVTGLFALLSVFPSLRLGLLAGTQPSFPAFFLTVFGVAASLHAWLAVRALPAQPARAEVRDFRGTAHGAGDPTHIPHAVQLELGSMRAGDASPNRVQETGFVLQRGGVRDSGPFEGRLLVETQPRFAGMADAPYAQGLLVAGALVQLLALRWWLATPDTPPTLTVGEGVGVAMTLRYAAQLVGASLLGGLGTRIVRSAGELLRGFRFESLAVLLDVRGTYARSQVRVGKGMLDSIETDNLVVRSDVYVAGWCAALLTECREPLGPRQVVGMIADDRTAEVELAVRRFLWRFEREQGAVAAVNLRDAGLLDVMQANLGLAAHREMMGERRQEVLPPPPA